MKIGIITFHNSYNCGSMLQTYALQEILKRQGHKVEIIDFSNEGQKQVYSIFSRSWNLKSICKNILTLLCYKRLEKNYKSYEDFKNNNFQLSALKYTKCEQLSDEGYDYVITGSDQVWNITIADGDDAYFLPWVMKAKKIAYAPSFGAKNILKYSSNPQKYVQYLKSFKNLSIREDNGKFWIKQLMNLDIPVLLDPTLLLSTIDYDQIASKNLCLPQKYIFYYSPSYSSQINKLVSCISKKYGLKVIAFNTKTYYMKRMFMTKFGLPTLENPSTYLQLIKNATLVITTSFHGTVFSSIYNKCFWVVKNGQMFITDDRVPTLVRNLDLADRVINIEFDSEFNYLKDKDYTEYFNRLNKEQEKSLLFLKRSLL